MASATGTLSESISRRVTIASLVPGSRRVTSRAARDPLDPVRRERHPLELREHQRPSSPVRPSSRRSACSARRKRMRAASSFMPRISPQRANGRPSSSRQRDDRLLGRRELGHARADRKAACPDRSPGRRRSARLVASRRARTARSRTAEPIVSAAWRCATRASQARVFAGGRQRAATSRSTKTSWVRSSARSERPRAVREPAGDRGAQRAVGAVDVAIGARPPDRAARRRAAGPGRDRLGARAHADASLGITRVLHGASWRIAPLS